ncbi:efflux RND transporter permease subunit [Oscillatoria sp. FACHB-1407]|uniref:efflux RND transporter permease subunit n=1 Tax=Oscillatoria sp. FACHB-1407 TaxID=2692847 RepID=UPI001683BE57|nr:efflux RND transporter permease subunit [Oscillatoria sp. FACHB-1407]MBD2464179.1 efflux RND transporter permease subunit [Oscillatoria sp. FACHB-1407]
MFANFFIKRPVFATVCALIILLLGAISIPTLPIAQFPEISPPQVTVNAIYTGADAEAVESSVTSILEREINGVQGLRYMTSSSSNSGTSTITVTFDASRDIDIAAVDVQNRISVAEPQLPESVQRTGITVNKESSNFLMAIGLYAENDQYDPIFLSNYADLYILDALRRIRGVGDVIIFGERQYAMRLWIDPTKLASRNLTPQDVVNAINAQNLQVGVGRIGQQPSPDEQLYQVDLRAVSRLTDPAEFENLVLRTEDDGTLIKFGDVGRVELGAEDYNSFLRFRGSEAVGLGITQLPGSNALDVARSVKQELERLQNDFPPGLQYQIAFDTTSFVEASLEELLITLITAIALVVVILFIFLQDWRNTLIPALTIPAALVGTFIFVKAFGFSLNSLTLFGLTLSTGVVVDDAIVVVEDISKKIQDQGLSPRRAAFEAMQELASAVVATSLVLIAVFVPVAFFPGTTGSLYRQFALTIAFAITVSTFLALTLTPALCALLLRRGQGVQSGPLRWFFDRFNQAFEAVRRRYERILNFVVRIRAFVIGLFVVSLGLTALLYLNVPTGFLPEEDQGYFITIVQAPEGVSLNYTDQVMQKIEQELIALPESLGVFAVGGFSLGSGNIANSGAIFTTLRPWSERRGPGQSVQAIIGQLFGKFSTITEARVFPVNPPPIQGLGNFGGFTFQLQDRRGTGDINQLVQAMGQLLGQANQTEGLQAVFSTYAASTPQLLVEVNRDAAEALQVSVEDVFNTLQTSIGSEYVNDFTLGQRNYRVYVQADEQFRSKPEDVGQLYVRSATDQMIPLSNLVTLTPRTGAQTINHYNLFRSIEINGGPAPGYSSGDAINAMEQVAGQVLPAGYGYEWSGTALEEVESGGQAPLIFVFGIIFVFLVLAAQYENYFDPLIILLAVPLAVLGALGAQSLRGLINDVYCQIGLVMLIGLASKNSILIVEFANQLKSTGLSTTKAVVEAAQDRLRPILMTALSSIAGFLPLMFATGAGAGSRQSLGTTVTGGLLVSTFLSLFIVPVLYIAVISVRDRLRKQFGSNEEPQLDEEY